MLKTKNSKGPLRLYSYILPMDHARENGEIYSNSVSKYFLNANFANNIIL